MGCGAFGHYWGYFMTYGRLRPAGTIALAAGLTSLIASTASATDLYTPNPGYRYKDSPAIVSYPNWAGFYAGGHIGGGWRNGGGQDYFVQGGTGGGGGGGGGDNNWCNNDCPVKTGNPPKNAVDGGDGANGNDGGAGGAGGNSTIVSDLPNNNRDRRIGGDGGAGGPGGEVSGSGDDDFLVGGLHLGYNWQYESLVFGLEGDVSLNGGVDDYLATLRARIGVNPQPDLLLYLTGGFAFRNGSGTDAIGLASAGGFGGDGGQNDDGKDDGNSEANDPATKGGLGGAGGLPGDPSFAGFDEGGGSDTGFVLGAGFEYMLTGNVSAGFEGLWYAFGGDEDVTVLRGRLTFHLDRSPHDSFKDSVLSAAVADWSGFYGGGNIGAGFGSGKKVASVKTDDGEDGTDGAPGAPGNVNNPAAANTLPKADGIDDPGGGGGGGGGGAAALVTLEDNSAILGGVHIGYNWQDDALVFGVEGDANWADDSFRDYLASVRLRVGHAFERVLVYGTAGVAFSRGSGGLKSVSVGAGGDGGGGEVGSFENDPNYTGGSYIGGKGGEEGPGGQATVTYQGGDEKIGFVVGGGFDVRLWERTSIGIEGLYYHFDGDDASSSATSYTAGDDLSAAVVRGRMTFHLQDEPQPLK